MPLCHAVHEADQCFTTAACAHTATAPPARLPTPCLLACLLQVSAALGAASMLLKADSPALAASWLSHAQQLHSWALEKQGEGRWVDTPTAGDNVLSCTLSLHASGMHWQLCCPTCVIAPALVFALPAGIYSNSLPDYQAVKDAGLVASSRCVAQVLVV